MSTTRLRLFFNFEKEERWLAAMAGEGFELVKKNCCGLYRFRSTLPEDAVIRIDYRFFKGKNDLADYKLLFEDSGWKHLAGSRCSGTQYFRKKSGNADDEIFSDTASKAGRYQRLAAFSFSLAAALLPVMTVVLTLRQASYRAFLDPGLLYQTPGLWEKTGADFWGAFLFETPFALLRGLPLLIFPAMVIFAFANAFCAVAAYRRGVR